MTMTVAATTPVAAASNVPTKTTARANPPRMGPMSIPMVSRSISASPDFSNMAPMKTKKGMARRVKSDMLPNQRLGMRRSMLRSNAPKARPIAPKMMAVPAKEKATG